MTALEARVVPARPTDPVDLSVLSLVTTPEEASYADQLEALSELGVETTILSAPGGGENDRPKGRSGADVRRLAAAVADRPLAEYDLLNANHGRTGRRRWPRPTCRWCCRCGDPNWAAGTVFRAGRRRAAPTPWWSRQRRWTSRWTGTAR